MLAKYLMKIKIEHLLYNVDNQISVGRWNLGFFFSTIEKIIILSLKS